MLAHQSPRFAGTVAFDLDAAKVVCADDVLRLRPDLQTTYTNRYFYACEYLEMQVMSIGFCQSNSDMLLMCINYLVT